MWWRKKKVSGGEEWTNHVALKFLNGYRYLQRKWVDFMVGIVKDWSIRKQKVMLIVLLMPVAVYCLVLVYPGARGKATSLSIEHIETGDHIGSSKIDSTKIKR